MRRETLLWLGVAASTLAVACGGGTTTEAATPADQPGLERGALPSRSAEERARIRMVEEQIEARDVRDAKVLAAMRRVPRHLFVPPAARADAHSDAPLLIGHEQTISQPYVVAFMTEALRLKGGEKVLEIGTGSGYQAAVLAEIAKDVYTIEIVAPLAARATETLRSLGYANVHVRTGDGYRGWPEHAPFDAIIVTAAPDHVPQPLVQQLAVGGRMILPVGKVLQELVVIEKTAEGVTEQSVLPVRFVPMTGEAQQPRPAQRDADERRNQK